MIYSSHRSGRGCLTKLHNGEGTRNMIRECVSTGQTLLHYTVGSCGPGLQYSLQISAENTYNLKQFETLFVLDIWLRHYQILELTLYYLSHYHIGLHK